MAGKKQQQERPKDHERQFEQVLKRLIQAPSKPVAKKAQPRRKKSARA